MVTCLLYTSDAADEEDSVDLGGRRIIKKKRTIRQALGTNMHRCAKFHQNRLKVCRLIYGEIWHGDAHLPHTADRPLKFRIFLKSKMAAAADVKKSRYLPLGFQNDGRPPS